MSGRNLVAERKQCLRELAALPGWVTGSLVETERTQSGKRQAFRYLSRSVGGRNRITYVSVEQVERFRESLRHGARARQLCARVVELTIAIIKASASGRGGQKA